MNIIIFYSPFFFPLNACTILPTLYNDEGPSRKMQIEGRTRLGVSLTAPSRWMFRRQTKGDAADESNNQMTIEKGR